MSFMLQIWMKLMVLMLLMMSNFTIMTMMMILMMIRPGEGGTFCWLAVGVRGVWGQMRTPGSGTAPGRLLEEPCQFYQIDILLISIISIFKYSLIKLLMSGGTDSEKIQARKRAWIFSSFLRDGRPAAIAGAPGAPAAIAGRPASAKIPKSHPKLIFSKTFEFYNFS